MNHPDGFSISSSIILRRSTRRRQYEVEMGKRSGEIAPLQGLLPRLGGLGHAELLRNTTIKAFVTLSVVTGADMEAHLGAELGSSVSDLGQRRANQGVAVTRGERPRARVGVELVLARRVPGADTACQLETSISDQVKQQLDPPVVAQTRAHVPHLPRAHERVARRAHHFLQCHSRESSLSCRQRYQVGSAPRYIAGTAG